jgi:hypothetical protein
VYLDEEIDCGALHRHAVDDNRAPRLAVGVDPWSAALVGIRLAVSIITAWISRGELKIELLATEGSDLRIRIGAAFN